MRITCLLTSEFEVDREEEAQGHGVVELVYRLAGFCTATS